MFNNNIETMKKSLFLIAFACATLFSVKFYAQDYQGEVDFGYSLGVGKMPSDRFNVSTVHGFEIEDYLFLGVGAGTSIPPLAVVSLRGWLRGRGLCFFLCAGA